MRRLRGSIGKTASELERAEPPGWPTAGGREASGRDTAWPGSCGRNAWPSSSRSRRWWPSRASPWASGRSRGCIRSSNSTPSVRAGLALPPAPVDTLLPDGVDPDRVRYRRAEASGTYDTDHGFVLYGRTQNSQAGNHLLTPLLLANGGAILVDRGWVPLDIDEPRAPEAAPPSGEVDVEGVLFSSEGDPPGAVGSADAAETTLSRADLATIQSQLPYPIAPAYLLLQRQIAGSAQRTPPAVASARAVRWSAPQLRDPMVPVRRDRRGRLRRAGAARRTRSGSTDDRAVG